MAKQKSPIVLISVIGILLVGAYLVNLGSRPKEEEVPPKPTSDATGPARPNVDPQEMAKAAREAVTKPVQKKAPMPHKGPPGVDPLVDKSQSDFKPKITDTQTSSDWWKKDSALGQK